MHRPQNLRQTAMVQKAIMIADSARISEPLPSVIEYAIFSTAMEDLVAQGRSDRERPIAQNYFEVTIGKDSSLELVLRTCYRDMAIDPEGLFEVHKGREDVQPALAAALPSRHAWPRRGRKLLSKCAGSPYLISQTLGRSAHKQCKT